MSVIPPIGQIARSHLGIFETYYRQVNPSGTATIGASQAAAFLKKSGLSEGTLHKVWNLADEKGLGYLDKQGFFVALKLVALAQSEKEVSPSNLTMNCQPPRLVGSDSPRGLLQPPESAWLIKAAEKQKYDGIFDTLQPVNGLVSGERVRPVLLNSKLSVDVLGRVWDMSDIDKDGMLDRDEFAVAMHLVYRALDGDPVPTTLPHRLIPPSKRKALALSVAVSTPASVPLSSAQPGISPHAVPRVSPVEKVWVVTPAEKAKCDVMFNKADTDKDGLVSGVAIKDVFIASGLQQATLAHIWGLCDINSTGLLNSEQFALALYLIGQKRAGRDPPNQLTPEMIPPSLRSKDESITSLSAKLAAAQANDFSAIKELDKINQDIEKLGREKIALQQEIEQTEEAYRKRKAEIEDLQDELEKAEKTIQELQKKKKEAQSKLDEADKEKSKYEDLLTEVKQKCQELKQSIALIRTQMATQESSTKNQEEELAQARKELNGLREEESRLEQQVQSGKEEVEQMKKNLANTRNEINQVRTRIGKLTEETQSINASINQYSTMTGSGSIGNSNNSFPSDLGSLPENLEATFPHADVEGTSTRATAGSSPNSSISGMSIDSGRVDEAVEDFKDNDPFKTRADPFSGTESEATDPFGVDDPFKTDPFKTVAFADDPFAGDPFQDKDPFHSEHQNSQDDDPFKADPFKPVTSTALPSEATTTQVSRPSEGLTDPFRSLDPFGSGAFTSTSSSKITLPDPFSVDPFESTSSSLKGSPSSSSISSQTNKDSKPTTNDPFADPFGPSDPFSREEPDPFSGGAPSASSDDPWTAAFGETASTDKISSDAPEDLQLEWARRESKRLEAERQKKLKELAEKEEMDVALALKQSVESSSDA